MQTPGQSAPLTMPSSPHYEVKSEIRDASAQMIEGEQWLHSHGWRDPILNLQTPKADLWLDGYRRFRRRLDLENDRAERRMLRRVLAVSVLATLSGIAVGLWVGARWFL